MRFPEVSCGACANELVVDLLQALDRGVKGKPIRRRATGSDYSMRADSRVKRRQKGNMQQQGVKVGLRRQSNFWFSDKTCVATECMLSNPGAMVVEFESNLRAATGNLDKEDIEVKVARDTRPPDCVRVFPDRN